MASIYKRSNVYCIKFYQNGRRIRKSLRTRKKPEALKIKEQIERELAAGQYVLENIDTDVDVFWEEYSKWAKDHKRARTLELEDLFWRQFTEFAKPKQLGDIRKEDIERFKSHRRRHGLRPTSINIALTHLQSIYSHAKKLGYYSGRNPFIGVARYKTEKNPPKFLSREQIEKVLSMSKEYGRNIYLVFALGIYAGLRKQEIVNARWEWFDFDQKLITLTSYHGFHLKDYETRTLPLHEKLARVLKPFRQDEGFLFAPEKEEQGKHRYRYEFNRAFRNLLKMTNLEWVTAHVLRHTFASQLAIAGVSLYKISKWLGHSDVKTTQIYAHLQTHDEDINRF